MDSAEVRAALAAALPSDALIIDPEIIRSLSHDEAEWAPFGEPFALIRPTSSDHVAASVRVCARLEFQSPHAVQAPGSPAVPTPLMVA